MKIFITGASGFIGRHVVDQFMIDGHEILILLRDSSKVSLVQSSKLKFLFSDLKDISKAKYEIKNFNPEVCIHLAWDGIPDYSENISRLNLSYSIELLNILTKETHCRKIIIAGSCLEYGKYQGNCEESDSPIIDSYFSWAKHSLYHYAALQCLKADSDLIWLRFFYVYGPGQRRNALIPLIVNSISQGSVPHIYHWQNANDFIYVQDVVDAMKVAMQSQIPSGIYNIGSGQSISVMDIFQMIKTQMKSKVNTLHKMEVGSSDIQTINFWANLTKTQETFGWKPMTSISCGIEKYIASIGIQA